MRRLGALLVAGLVIAGCGSLLAIDETPEETPTPGADGGGADGSGGADGATDGGTGDAGADADATAVESCASGTTLIFGDTFPPPTLAASWQQESMNPGTGSALVQNDGTLRVVRLTSGGWMVRQSNLPTGGAKRLELAFDVQLPIGSTPLVLAQIVDADLTNGGRVRIEAANGAVFLAGASGTGSAAVQIGANIAAPGTGLVRVVLLVDIPGGGFSLSVNGTTITESGPHPLTGMGNVHLLLGTYTPGSVAPDAVTTSFDNVRLCAIP